MRRDQQHLPGLVFETLNLGMDTVLAGGGKDGVKQSGPWFPVHFADKAVSPNDVTHLEGLQVAARTLADVANGETAQLALNLQDAADDSGTDAADFGNIFPDPASPPFVLADGTSGAVVAELAVNLLQQSLEGARSHVRVQWLIILSAGSIDQIVISLGGRASAGTEPAV